MGKGGGLGKGTVQVGEQARESQEMQNLEKMSGGKNPMKMTEPTESIPIPEKYGNATTSPIKKTVKKGTNPIDIDLED